MTHRDEIDAAIRERGDRQEAKAAHIAALGILTAGDDIGPEVTRAALDAAKAAIANMRQPARIEALRLQGGWPRGTREDRG